MAVINPGRHPLLARAAQGAQWLGTDDYPAFNEWADDDERRLRFIDSVGALDLFLPRLRGSRQQRDEALAEIRAADLLVTHCGCTILAWEPPGANGRTGDLLVRSPHARRALFVEVKAPGYEAEVPVAQRAARSKQLKYVPGLGGAFDPGTPVRYAIEKAYTKFPFWRPTLLVICDDLMVPLRAVPDLVQEALYRPRGGSQTQDGPFAVRNFNRLGAIATLNVELTDQIKYAFSVFPNPHALLTTAVPHAIFGHFPVSDGGAWRPRGIAAGLSRYVVRGLDTVMAPIMDAAGQVKKLFGGI